MLNVQLSDFLKSFILSSTDPNSIAIARRALSELKELALNEERSLPSPTKEDFERSILYDNLSGKYRVNKVWAIKRYRQRTGAGLSQAKNIVLKYYESNYNLIKLIEHNASTQTVLL